jgi:hypothetical protein
MAKGIPKYRCVEYTNDGCSIWQCLSCKAKWECRYGHFHYCGNCGVKWEGELVWDSEAKYQGYEGQEPPPPEKRWYIEKKVIDRKTGEIYRDWTACYGYQHEEDIIARAAQVRRVADDLRRYRKGEELWARSWLGSLRTEYRVVLGEERPVAFDGPPDDYRLADLEEEVRAKDG